MSIKALYEFISRDGGCCDELILTKDMRERKSKLDSMSDAVIALPGGFGTLEEISEIIDEKILGYTTKPIVLLNTNNFYDKLMNVFEQYVEEKFAKKESMKHFFVAKTPQEAVEYIKTYVPNEPPKSVSDIYVK